MGLRRPCIYYIGYSHFTVHIGLAFSIYRPHPTGLLVWLFIGFAILAGSVVIFLFLSFFSTSGLVAVRTSYIFLLFLKEKDHTNGFGFKSSE